MINAGFTAEVRIRFTRDFFRSFFSRAEKPLYPIVIPSADPEPPRGKREESALFCPCAEFFCTLEFGGSIGATAPRSKPGR